MNAGTFNNNSPENTVPVWLLPCTCQTSRCSCNARFKPDILCVKGLPYNIAASCGSNPELTIQFIEFTYCNDRFSPDTINRKLFKYQPLITSLIQYGWKVDPLIVITVGARTTTHIPSIKILKEKFNIPKSQIKPILTDINTIAIHHAMSILLYKQKLENNQPLPLNYDPP